MNYKVIYMDEIIATFKDEGDAKAFVEWKREQLLFAMNGKLLDRIAAENHLDRKFPGLFPLSITQRYFDEAIKQIEANCLVREEAMERKPPKVPESGQAHEEIRVNQEIEEDIMEQKQKEINSKINSTEYDAILNSLLDSLEKHRMLEEKKQVEFCSAYLQKVEADLVSILERLETLQAQIPKEGQLNGIIQEKVSEAVRELNEARDDAKEIKLVFQSSVKKVAMDYYKDATALKLRQAVGKLKIPETLGKVKEILNKAEDKMKKSGEWIGVMRGRRQAAAMYRWNAKRVLRGEPALDPVVPENHKGFLANLQTFFWSTEKKLKKAALQCEAAAGKVQAFASEKKIRPEAGRMK